MRPDWGKDDLNGELVFNRFLGHGDQLDTLQEVLVDAAPRWCRRLRLWRDVRDQVPIDLSDPHALANAVLTEAGERGETYRTLVETYGRGPYERFFGAAELRGAGPELTVVVDVDEWVVSPLGTTRQLGNSIALQVRRSRVEGKAGSRWLEETVRALCDRLSPAWGVVCQEAEYWAKAMSDGPTIEAVGRDFGRHLPGVFWLNFFGRPYRQLLGDDRLRQTPARRVQVIDDGVLVRIGDEPGDWVTPDYAAVERQVRDHLGPELFFSKSEPDRVGVVPDWEA